MSNMPGMMGMPNMNTFGTNPMGGMGTMNQMGFGNSAFGNSAAFSTSIGGLTGIKPNPTYAAANPYAASGLP